MPAVIAAPPRAAHRALGRTLRTTLVAALAACGGGDSDFPTEEKPVASVAVTPATATVLAGRTTTLGAAARAADGTAITRPGFTWTSSADGVARVDANGVVTGVAPGTAVVTATTDGRSGQATITVQAVPVAAVVVAPATATVAAGSTVTLAATTRDDQGAALAGRAVTWTTSAPSVATVDAAGVVRGVAAGTATITATSEGRSGTAAVTVTAPVVPVAAVAVTAALDTVEAFAPVTLQATLRDRDGAVLTGRAVRWSVSDAAVARIDSVTGALTGLDRGTVTVTARSEGVTGTATRVVVVRYRSIVAGTMHACDIASGGIAWCWGLAGNEGRLGDGRTGTTVTSPAPVRVSGDLRFAQLAAYGRHTCGLTTEGRAYCWGYNGWGQLGAGVSANQVPTPTAVSGGHTFRSITIGAEHSCGVTTDGRTLCWGYNASGQLGTGATASRDVPVAVSGSETFASVDAGTAFTCGVSASAAGYCWGFGGLGQLGDGGRISGGGTFVTAPQLVVGDLRFRAISAGDQHACGVTTAGAAYCWGSSPEQLGAGGGLESSRPVAVAGGLTFRAVAAGYAHSCGVTTGDEVWCWGSNRYNQLGVPGGNASNRPVRAGAITASEVTAAGVGTGQGAHSCAIAADRLTAWCWGLNDAGQLGGGTQSPLGEGTATPTIVQGQRPLPR